MDKDWNLVRGILLDNSSKDVENATLKKNINTLRKIQRNLNNMKRLQNINYLKKPCPTNI